MIQYLVSQQTSILTIDDINLVNFIKRTDDNKSKNYTVFKKISKLNALTNANNFFNIASVISTVEITSILPTVSRWKNNDAPSNTRVFGLMYKKSSDVNNVYYVEPVICDDIVTASSILNTRIEGYDNVIKESISVFQIGSIIGSDENKESIKDKRFSIAINEQKVPSMLIKEGLDSFKEFNRKVYVAELSISYVSSNDEGNDNE
jgi:hypothetical protein